MAKILKKFWFVIVVAFLFIGMFVYVVYDENKGKLKGLKHNGQDVVFSIGDNIITAEMLYEKINQDNSNAIHEILLERFHFMTLNQSMPVTKEMRKEAEDLIQTYIIVQFQRNYGEQYQYYFNAWMTQQGFRSTKDIVNKFTLPYYVIRPKLINNYLESHLDELFGDFYEKDKPRQVAHILVKMEDSENPTEEELAKVAAIEEALKTKDFGAVAQEFSDDGSAEGFGDLGIITATTKSGYVSEFAEAALKLENNEVSEWVVTIYGWHLIKNTGDSKDFLVAHEDFYDIFSLYYNDLTYKIIYDKALELGVNYFGNDALQKYIIDSFGGDN